jgi:hypothetical protein
MKVRIQNSCDAAPSWPLYPDTVHDAITRALFNPIAALVDPFLSKLLDDAFELTDVPTIRHQYAWISIPGAQIHLRHPLDMAIFRFALLEEHPEARLETFLSPLMHPTCHTPPLPVKAQVALGPDGFWHSIEPPDLTTRQREWPGYRLDEEKRAISCEEGRLFVLKRGIGGPDEGIRLTLSTEGKPTVCLIRTCAPLDSVCKVDGILFSPTRGWYHNGANGDGDAATYMAVESWSPRLRYIDRDALTHLLAPQRRDRLSLSLASAFDLLRMSDEMPVEGLFSGKRMKAPHPPVHASLT